MRCSWQRRLKPAFTYSLQPQLLQLFIFRHDRMIRAGLVRWLQLGTERDGREGICLAWKNLKNWAQFSSSSSIAPCASYWYHDPKKGFVS